MTRLGWIVFAVACAMALGAARIALAAHCEALEEMR